MTAVKQLSSTFLLLVVSLVSAHSLGQPQQHAMLSLASVPAGAG